MSRISILTITSALCLVYTPLGISAEEKYERMDLYDRAGESYQRRDCVGVIKNLYGFKVINEKLLSKNMEWTGQIDGLLLYCEELVYRQLVNRSAPIPGRGPAGGWGGQGYGWGGYEGW